MRKYNFVERLARAEKVLKEAGLLTEKGLSKAQKEQILKAHASKGGTSEKARILKDFTKEQKKVLIENWIVGKLPDEKIFKIIQRYVTSYGWVILWKT